MLNQHDSICLLRVLGLRIFYLKIQGLLWATGTEFQVQIYLTVIGILV